MTDSKLDSQSYQAAAKERLRTECNASENSILVYDFVRTGALLAKYIEQAVCRPHGLSYAGFRLLFILGTSGALTQKNFAEVSRVSAASASSGVETLQKRGYLRRVRSAADRRVIHLHLTDAGKALSRVVTNEYAGVLNALGEGLQVDDMVVSSLLETLQANLEGGDIPMAKPVKGPNVVDGA